MKNSKKDRYINVLAYREACKESKKIIKKINEIKEDLLKMYEDRSFDSEEFEDGTKITIVQQQQSTLNKEKLANLLKISPEQLASLMKQATDKTPKAKYPLVTPI